MVGSRFGDEDGAADVDGLSPVAAQASFGASAPSFASPTPMALRLAPSHAEDVPRRASALETETALDALREAEAAAKVLEAARAARETEEKAQARRRYRLRIFYARCFESGCRLVFRWRAMGACFWRACVDRARVRWKSRDRTRIGCLKRPVVPPENETRKSITVSW